MKYASKYCHSYIYIYTAYNIQGPSWAAVGAQTETRVLQPKIGSEASLHNDFI